MTDNTPIEVYDQYVSLLNVYTCYFKHLFVKPAEYTMFNDIDYEKENSTNRCMELFYDDIFKLKQCPNEDDKDLIPCEDVGDIADYPELYVLSIDGVNKYACQYVIPLIQYVASLDNCYDIYWSINNLKRDI